MWHVYVIRNNINKRFYTGITKDIVRRVAQHNKSKSRSITHFGKYDLVYSETYDTFREARKREHQIKSYKSGNAFKKMLREKADLIV